MAHKEEEDIFLNLKLDIKWINMENDVGQMTTHAKTAESSSSN